MTLSSDSQHAVDAYLAALRKQLRDLLDEDANEIVKEIRAHILDRASGDDADAAIIPTLAALGAPAELARRYRTEELLQRAQLAQSPRQTLRRTLRRFAVTGAGLLIILLSALGYCVGGALLILGALKIAYPQNTGVWFDKYKNGTTGSAMQFGSSPRVVPDGVQTTHELLGWWFVPIALLVGSGLLFLTFRLGLWGIRTLRHPHRGESHEDAASNQAVTVVL